MQKPTPATLRATFADPAAFGITLLLALWAAYGPKAIFGGDAEEDTGEARYERDDLGASEGGWAPETFAMHVAEDYGVRLEPSRLGRAMAALTIAREPGRFYDRVPDFLDLANALNGDSYDPGVFDPVDVSEAAWAIYEARLVECLFEPDDDTESQLEFSEQIRGYLAAILDEAGIVDPPDVLRLAAGDPDRMARVLSGWTDDPAMFSAIKDAEDQKAAAVTTELKARLHLLFQQLARLFGTDIAGVVEGLGIAGLAGLE